MLFRHCSLLIAVSALCAAERPQDDPFRSPSGANNAWTLETRRRAQTRAAASVSAFHGFQFTDAHARSGIAWEHHFVDDAGKFWIPVHYDHGNAVAAADVDGDGRTDLYFVNQLGTNGLFRSLGGARFEDITAKAGVGMAGQICVAASFGDVDNDGDPDLFVTTVRHGNHLFENLGGGAFRDITATAGVGYSGHSSGAVFLDFNGDGRLDLFVANIGNYTQDERGRGGFFRGRKDAFKGHLFPERTERSLLYENLGGGKFREVGVQAGLTNTGWNGDATLCDVNDDGRPDLYAVNMQGDDHLFLNDGAGRFADRTRAFFPKTPWGAMGASFLDFDNDGRTDVFVADMHSDMTDRQTSLMSATFRLDLEKRKSEAWCGPEWGADVLRGAANSLFGNAFFKNLGDGRFAEVSDAVGAETYWPWGASVGDVNADGFEDLFITAGMGHRFRYAVNSLLLNERGTRFFDAEFLTGIEPRAGGRTEKTAFILDCDGLDKDHALCAGQTGRLPVSSALSSRSSALLDLDDDGDLDIVTAEFNDRPQVLLSDLSARRKIHFLKVQLRGTASNRAGLGALVRVGAGDTTQTRFHGGRTGYLSQGSVPLYFGLGDAVRANVVEVRWPSGRKQIVTEGIPANGLLTLTEPQ